jgi:hypothetical protein
MRLPSDATGPPKRAKPEPVGTEALEFGWSGERRLWGGKEDNGLEKGEVRRER